jgi:hypothetical protein
MKIHLLQPQIPLSAFFVVSQLRQSGACCGLSSEALGGPHSRASYSPAGALQHFISRNATSFIAPYTNESLIFKTMKRVIAGSRAPTGATEAVSPLAQSADQPNAEYAVPPARIIGRPWIGDRSQLAHSGFQARRMNLEGRGPPAWYSAIPNRPRTLLGHLEGFGRLAGRGGLRKASASIN